MEEITLRPVGVIRSPFRSTEDAPIQPAFAGGAQGTVEVFDEFAGGLEGLDGFSHVILIYHFHLSRGFSLRVRPYLDEKVRGVFATRAPRRPNPVGLSVVRLAGVDGGTLRVVDIDVVDGTPLLDIKPHVPEFDSSGPGRVGWLEGKVDRK